MGKSEALKAIGLFTTLGLFVVGGGYLYYASRKTDKLFTVATFRALTLLGVLVVVQIAGFILSR